MGKRSVKNKRRQVDPNALVIKVPPPPSLAESIIQESRAKKMEKYMLGVMGYAHGKTWVKARAESSQKMWDMAINGYIAHESGSNESSK